MKRNKIRVALLKKTYLVLANNGCYGGICYLAGLRFFRKRKKSEKIPEYLNWYYPEEYSIQLVRSMNKYRYKMKFQKGGTIKFLDTKYVITELYPRLTVERHEKT